MAHNGLTYSAFVTFMISLRRIQMFLLTYLLTMVQAVFIGWLTGSDFDLGSAVYLLSTSLSLIVMVLYIFYINFFLHSLLYLLMS